MCATVVLNWSLSIFEERIRQQHNSTQQRQTQRVTDRVSSSRERERDRAHRHTHTNTDTHTGIYMYGTVQSVYGILIQTRTEQKKKKSHQSIIKSVFLLSLSALCCVGIIFSPHATAIARDKSRGKKLIN